jgi:hypothetical protein
VRLEALALATDQPGSIGQAKPMGVGNRRRPFAPGLARWRLSDRRRNDSGKAKRLPRGVCEDREAGGPGLDRRRGRAQGRNGNRRRAGARSGDGRRLRSIADAAGLDPATHRGSIAGACARLDPATHRTSIADAATDLATDLATHRGSPTLAIAPALAMTPADANASHGPSVSIGLRAGAGGLDPAMDLPRATGDGLAMATGDGLATDRPGDMLATHRASPTAFSAPPLAMTPATVSASHGASVSASHGASVSDDAGACARLDPATDLATGSIADAAGLKGACAQPDPATHSASPTAFSAPPLATTPDNANACHGPSVSLEAGRAMATHRGSLAGVFPTADAMTAARPNACHGPSVSLGRWR